jgi:hypothetical protein
VSRVSDIPVDHGKHDVQHMCLSTPRSHIVRLTFGASAPLAAASALSTAASAPSTAGSVPRKPPGPPPIAEPGGPADGPDRPLRSPARPADSHARACGFPDAWRASDGSGRAVSPGWRGTRGRGPRCQLPEGRCPRRIHRGPHGRSARIPAVPPGLASRESRPGNRDTPKYGSYQEIRSRSG